MVTSAKAAVFVCQSSTQPGYCSSPQAGSMDRDCAFSVLYEILQVEWDQQLVSTA